MNLTLLLFALAFFGAMAFLNWRKYRQTGRGIYLRGAILSLIMCLLPLFVLTGNLTLAVVALLLLIGAAIYALYMVFVGEQKYTIAEQLKSYDGELTWRDVLFTWKPLARLERKVGKVWASVLYGLVIASVTTAVFLGADYLLRGEVNIYDAVTGVFPVMFVMCSVMGYRALLAASGREETEKERATFGLLFVLVVLLPVLVVIGTLLLSMLNATHIPASKVLAVTYGAERGRCGQIVKQGWEYLQPKVGSVEFSAWVQGYCDPKGTVHVYGVPEGNRVNVYVDYNGMVTRCFCPFHITGTMKIPEDLPAGEYNFVLVFRVSSTGAENVIDSKMVKIG